jgi:hypothetical protein
LTNTLLPALLNCGFTSLFGEWGKNSKRIPLYRTISENFP